MMEHRHLARRRTFALVEIQDYGKQINIGLVYNITSHGAFILCTASPNVNRIVEIYISVPAEDSLLTLISGIVIHRNNNGFGLMFCEQNSPTRLLVNELSSSYAEPALH
jgi:hypothetical protein